MHWFPTGLLARPNTGQVGLYRARVQTGHPAAPLVHINPLKDWGFVEELVTRPGCGHFEQFKDAKSNKTLGGPARTPDRQELAFRWKRAVEAREEARSKARRRKRGKGGERGLAEEGAEDVLVQRGGGWLKRWLRQTGAA